MKTFVIVAEYCDGPFYMGWWIYVRPTSKRRNEDGAWGWIRDEYQLRLIRELVAPELPEPKRFDQKFAEAFARQFPKGVKILADSWYSHSSFKRKEASR